MKTETSTPQAAAASVLQSLLPTRRRFAALAVTVTWLMAAMFLMLGMEARSHELRIATVAPNSVASTTLHAPAQRRR